MRPIPPLPFHTQNTFYFPQSVAVSAYTYRGAIAGPLLDQTSTEMARIKQGIALVLLIVACICTANAQGVDAFGGVFNGGKAIDGSSTNQGKGRIERGRQETVDRGLPAQLKTGHSSPSCAACVYVCLQC